MKSFTSKMYFCNTIRIIVFILFQLKGIFSKQELCLENDITKHIDKWVTSIFSIDSENAIKLISAMKDYKPKEFETDIENNVNHFHDKFFFQNVSFQLEEESEYDSDGPESPQIHRKFPENEMSIFLQDLLVRIWGTIGTVKNEAFTDFNTTLYLENYTFTAVASRMNDKLVVYNTTFGGYCHELMDDEDVYWTNQNLTDEDKEQLARELKPLLPEMLSENMKNNPEVAFHLDDIFDTYEKPRKKIISEHPNFLTNPQQYYYLIPKIPFYCFVLRRVVIHGLSNFESFKNHEDYTIFTHTLLVRNVQGRMTLYYRTKEETPLELSFHIDCLFVSKTDDIECAHAQAKYYSITRTKTNVTLSARQSEVIMNGLESAIASSLLPTMEVGKICDLETPLDKIKISNGSDWKTIKQSYKGWIPFNDD
ncbi:uncharacterized protein LOC135837314 [Planococcus citri]|uniref:uncharacterized protein LOC135837314 n=1 Tax=Planococcus citri TaxID=170843 RepID=UPI0031F85CA4